MESKKILIIANPKAGRGKIAKHIEQIMQNLEKLSYQIDVEYTSLENGATEILRNNQKVYDKLIVCGGDGTLNQVVQALGETDQKIPVGYITVGTTNDFARSLGVNSKNVYDIAKNLEKYQEKEVDVGKFNERFFNYVASIGVFSKASYGTSTKLKNKFGRIAYIFKGIRELLFYETYHLKIFTKDAIIENEFIYGSVSNSYYVGGFPIFKKEKIDLADGEFEVLLVKKPKNMFQLFRLAARILTGHLKNEDVYFFRTSYLKIETEQETEWSIDGEYSGKVKNIEIYNLPRKMLYLVPKEVKK